MRSLVLALVFCTGCALFEAGSPTDPLAPSPADQAIVAAKEAYEGSPFKDFGPYGAGIAALLAIGYGVKRGYSAYQAKKTAKV